LRSLAGTGNQTDKSANCQTQTQTNSNITQKIAQHTSNDDSSNEPFCEGVFTFFSFSPFHRNLLIEESANQINDNRNNYTYQYHRSNWKIKPETIFLYSNIPRQPAKPAEKSPCIIQQDPCYKDYYPYDNEIFSNNLVHFLYSRFNLQCIECLWKPFLKWDDPIRILMISWFNPEWFMRYSIN